MPRHYLDHASVSPLRPEASAALEHWLTLPAADPGRLHQEGQRVRVEVEAAREAVARTLGVRPRQVVFTAGATEAIVTATWTAIRDRPGMPVLGAPVERAAARESAERWATLVDLAVDGRGRLDLASLDTELDRVDGAALVHCQWGNQEVGTLQPVGAVVARCRAADVPVHVDASAAAGHVPLDLDGLGADFVSVSAHTMGGPPGVGALVLRRGLRPQPIMLGGQQERGRRAGLENVPGILGFAAAAAAASAAMEDEGRRARRQVGQLIEAARAVPGVEVVGDPDPDGRLPHVVCIGIDGVEAEPVLLGLDRAGVAAHSGSACATELFEPSPVLEAMGVDSSRSLRLSVGWSTTERDVAAFARAFPQVVGELRALAGTGEGRPG